LKRNGLTIERRTLHVDHNNALTSLAREHALALAQ
jgi:hypothetical protein